MDQTLILFAVLLFVAVVLAIEGAYQAWSAKHGTQAKRIASRLAGADGLGAAEPLSIERAGKSKRFPLLDDLLALLPNGQKLVRYVDTAGVGLSAGEMFGLSLVLGAIGFVAPWMVGKPFFMVSILLALVLSTLPWLWLSWRRNKRVRLFERQLPEALDLMGRALRAGHAFPTGLKMVGEEMPEPIAREFRVLFDEMNYGRPQHEALLRLADRVPVEDVRYFVIAVNIQRETGGNLAELLDNISAIVRARLKLMGEIRTLSAEGKMSAWVLGLLPFALGLVVNLVNPKFMSVLWTDPAGVFMISGALILMFFGVLWMRKIIRIRV
jgi:tight adherence protein B